MNYSIKYVANVTGLSEHRIRAWEKRYQLLNPERSSKGRRLYQDSDIEKLGFVKTLIENGQKVGHMASLTTQQLREKAQKFSGSQLTQGHLQGRKLEWEEKQLKHFILEQSLLGHRIDVLEHELKRASDISLEAYLDHILLPFFKKLQELQSSHKLPEGRETLIKRIIAQTLKLEFHSLQEKLNFQSKNTFDVIVATTDQKFGEIDSWLCALRVLMTGSSVFHLGAIGPSETLRNLIQALNPKRIVLTDRVDGPTTSLNSAKVLGEVFPTRGQSPHCPLPKEKFLWEKEDTEILLLLQGSKAKRTGPLESFQGLRLFESLDGLQGHIGKTQQQNKPASKRETFSSEISA